ncbi:MAG: FAD-binding oxidoreductase, partial [candidate division Zixibacteria bacterium]|nr:FAD-binding oxidoreductase [candidate division Zixibacteria bacterium]
MSNPDFSELARALRNPASLVTNLSGWEEYFHDATEESTTPAFIVLAECAADVIAAVSFAEKHRIPLTPRGAGTGLSGGCVPPKNGLVLSTERMKKLTIDPEKRIAVCGPGVITKELLDASAPHGLTYPPDPASYNECSLGGNVAENAGGLRCKRYGVTRDYVIGIKAVTARGSTLETGIYNDNRGFSIEDILIGSEGTLAVITELTVRLIETPSAGNTILIAFDDSRNAARAVSEITAAGIIPTVMEYLDGDAADCSNRYEKYDGLDRVAAILLIETAGDRKTEQTTSVRNLCERNHCSYLRIAENP